MFDFENLDVYRKAEALGKEILKYLKENRVDLFLGDQLKRAILSIILNIAEGAGRLSKRDKKNFYVMARGSTYECVSIIRVLRSNGEIKEDAYSSFYRQLEELSKMLNGLIQSMQR